MKVFEITMPLFMLIGIFIVLAQLVAIFTGNGSLLVWVYKTFYQYASTASSICMFSAFLYSYVRKA